jgi:hypothetical protein
VAVVAVVVVAVAAVAAGRKRGNCCPVPISAGPLNLLRLGGHVVSFLVVGGGIVGNHPV